MWFTRRRRSLLLTFGGALLFIVAAAVAALGWRRRDVVYRPGESMEGVTAELDRDVPIDHPKVVFRDVTRVAGITFRHFEGRRGSWLAEDMGSGAAWGDYDGDGWVDLAVANEVGSIDMTDAERRRSPARFALYHNNRDGTFTDVTEKAGVAFRGWGMAVSWADYDNDGHVDLLITAYGHNVLYHNNGDGTFTDRSVASGIGVPDGFWAGAAWGDYDRDGFLDLYVTGYVQFIRRSTNTAVNGRYDIENPASINPLAFPGERNLLFHNDGHGTFTERAGAAAVVDAKGRSLAASWVDIDEDGWPDLYVANDVSQNVLYRNLHDGRFQEISEAARVSDYRSSMGIAVGDWNGDGKQDLFLTHWLAQGNALYDNRSLVDSTTGSRTPIFMDESDRYGLGQISLDYVGWATSFVDYDDDGQLDLFVVNGSTLQQHDDPSHMVPMKSSLFWNHGTPDGFFDVSPVSGAYFQTPYVGRGAAFADYDNDGDVDVFVVNHGGPGVLLRNDGGNRNHWLQVELVGTKSNRQGIGAKVRVVAGGAVQVRQIGVQAPYLSQNSLVETFGLGQRTRVDTVDVRWPSGARDVQTDLLAGERALITEGAHATAPAVLTSATAMRPNPPTTVDRDRIQQFWSIYREASDHRIRRETRLASEGYARALELNPDHEDALYYFGSMRVELGDYDAASRAWRHLLAVNPVSARTHSQLGVLYQCLERGAPFQLDSAEWHLQRAHELNKEENGPLLRLGEVALLRGDSSSAHRYFRTVLATDTSNATAHFYTGYLAYKQNDLTLAGRERGRAHPAPAPTAPVAGATSEGDTKQGNSPLRRDGDRCNELRAAALRPRTQAGDPDPFAAYRELDNLLRGPWRPR